MSGGDGHGRVSASVLGRSPEIAVLDGLGHTLRIAIAAKRALNPELATPWSIACPLRVKAATLVLAHAESLLPSVLAVSPVVVRSPWLVAGRNCGCVTRMRSSPRRWGRPWGARGRCRFCIPG